MGASDKQEAFDFQGFVKSLTHRPGVYRFLDADGEVLYVGKARNLKKRVASYFTRHNASIKTRMLIKNAASVDVTVTGTETEAVLLEYNLIKQHRPRYNVVLRDDKSFPYIYVSTDHAYPRLSFYRGAKSGPGRYFGPYPSAHAVRSSINQLQKMFRLRQCDNTFFSNRSRPCLQFQIKRCSAPCVGLISAADYAQEVRHAMLFLEGRDEEVIRILAHKMDAASESQDYEKAAALRDQISTLKRVDEKQFVSSGPVSNADVLSIASDSNLHCITVMYIRTGRNLGSRSYFPRTGGEPDPGEVLNAFVPQYYLSRDVPAEIIVNTSLRDAELLAAVLADRSGHAVNIKQRVRGHRKAWLDMGDLNAQQALRQRLASNAGTREQLKTLRDLFGLEDTPSRIECFDVSHTAGEAAVAACVVFDHEGMQSGDYRKFNVKPAHGGDDYGALREALQRRYTRIKRGEAPEPDILLVDGGRGQVREAAAVLEELQLDGIAIAGVAKGPGRRPGTEQLVLLGRKRPIKLPPDSPVLHLIQRIRDEAHRFAITGHRTRRGKARQTSMLESIPGLGPKRRRSLLQEFGGLQGVMRAGIEDLTRVKGISRSMAQAVYETIHSKS